ncbi:zona pellucida-binding protein 1 isoform X3 [Dermochelys coriacea]|uniref:zona pellucida-binding protein 1 isoform X3 n=1 Tax=Dermochelys coriacea TaxID=27794 RepID=UPI001CA9A971|nr:zona pellucida-binding protein 1 isoform X3 [Dermochelys coriacea]
MADSPPGAARRRGRGWRRRRRVGAFPSSAFRLPALGVTFLFLLLQRPPAVQSSRRFSGSANPKHNDLKIVGSTTFPVKIYVKLNHNSPRILCVTNRLRNSELIDPVFQWHGPGGDLVAENSSVKITPTGTLIFRHFKYDMSGIYTCSLVFKPTAEQAEKNYLLKYVIYAYSDPNFYYEFTARYHAAPCNSIYNISFEKKLLQILSKLVIELSCEVTLLKSECHHVKMQKAGLQNEIFFTFTVSSLDTEKNNNPCQQKSCDTAKRLKKLSAAQDHIIPTMEFTVFSATIL